MYVCWYVRVNMDVCVLVCLYVCMYVCVCVCVVWPDAFLVANYLDPSSAQ